MMSGAVVLPVCSFISEMWGKPKRQRVDFLCLSMLFSLCLQTVHQETLAAVLLVQVTPEPPLSPPPVLIISSSA